MLSRPTRLLAAAALSLIAFAPFTASAQVYTGSNGKLVYLDTTGNLLSSNPDGQGTTTLATAAALGGQPSSDVSVNKAQTKVVFENTGATGLESANLDGSGQFALTATAGDASPVWSPDSSVVFFTNAAHDIMSVHADGTARSTILAHSGTVTFYSPTISPDDTVLAFSRFDSTTNVTDIATAGVAGGAVTNLTNFPNTSFGSGPDFSPNGTTVTFGMGNGTLSSIATVPVGGGTVTTVTSTASGSCTGTNYFSPAYSPDGTHVAFSSAPNTCSGGGGYTTATLNTVATAGTGLTPLTGLGQVSPGYWSGLVLAAETTPTPVPSLPAAGGLKTTTPIALGVLGILAAAGIELTRRLRRTA